jgi:hypothetical protein
MRREMKRKQSYFWPPKGGERLIRSSASEMLEK